MPPETEVGLIDLKDFDCVEIRTFRHGRPWMTETFWDGGKAVQRTLHVAISADALEESLRS